MDKDEVLEIALSAGGLKPNMRFYEEDFIAFASAIETAVREECANIIERQDVDPAFKLRMASAIRNMGKEG